MVYCWQDVVAIEEHRLALGGDPSWLMGFNEPDIREQCNLSAASAASWWLRVEALAHGRQLVSPAVVNPDWLEAFWEEYSRIYERPPHLNALAVHCYRNTAEGCRGVVQEVMDLAELWDVPEVWVTEFSFWGGAEAQKEAKGFIGWLNTQGVRYAWFPARLDGKEYWSPSEFWLNQVLISWDGELTRWGKIYRGAN